MNVSGFLRSRLTLQHFHQRKIALSHASQCLFHIVEMLEAKHAFRASAQFSESLRSSQQQRAKEGGFSSCEIEYFLQAMFVFRHAAVSTASRTSKPIRLQPVQRGPDGILVEVHHRL